MRRAILHVIGRTDRASRWNTGMANTPRDTLYRKGKGSRVLKIADEIAALRTKRATPLNRERIAKLEEQLRAEFPDPQEQSKGPE